MGAEVDDKSRLLDPKEGDVCLRRGEVRQEKAERSKSSVFRRVDSEVGAVGSTTGIYGLSSEDIWSAAVDSVDIW